MTQTPFRSMHGGRDSALQPVEMRMILIAGADVATMQQAASRLFQAGHMPVMGEWFSEPLLELPEVERSAEAPHDLTERLLARCDAVLRVGGPSTGADTVVGLGRSRGLRVFFDLNDALDG